MQRNIPVANFLTNSSQPPQWHLLPQAAGFLSCPMALPAGILLNGEM
jgi:hypothetical protein